MVEVPVVGRSPLVAQPVLAVQGHGWARAPVGRRAARRPCRRVVRPGSVWGSEDEHPCGAGHPGIFVHVTWDVHTQGTVANGSETNVFGNGRKRVVTGQRSSGGHASAPPPLCSSFILLFLEHGRDHVHFARSQLPKHTGTNKGKSWVMGTVVSFCSVFQGAAIRERAFVSGE